jgi:prepilin-type N-terminal cleavage/methylation domain-containing protein
MICKNKKTKYLAQTVFRQGGFTLVETLVAISILTLSIMATFTAVQNSLQSSSFSKDQITAFYLAQEAVEYVRNMRDTNTISGRDWMEGLLTPGDECNSGTPCKVDVSQKSFSHCSSTCPLLRQDPVTGLFGYNSGWTETRFRREIKIEEVKASDPPEVLVIVTMSWTSNGFAKTFQAKQYLTNWQ